MIVFVVLAVLFGGCLFFGAIANLTDDGSDTTTTKSVEDAADVADETGAAAPAPEATTKAAVKPATKPPAKPKPAQPGLNTPVRDGKFEFTVTKVSCGKEQVGSGFLVSKAQGEFCLVNVTVKNIGDEAQTFTGGSQKAFDGRGVEYSNDGGAELSVNSGAETFLEEINPGNSVKGTLVFDVPESTKLTTIELHDSFWSGGAKVALK
ncbi:DUF4352 domain-containing protein [Actinoplanes sp. NPDC051513]|uniref:DUF4352 domain-containing protein n=1 Tax=Actinoplanes sp. NPDC051513 TaxID=3363908 RepID=UPI0037AEA0C2